VLCAFLSHDLLFLTNLSSMLNVSYSGLVGKSKVALCLAKHYVMRMYG
jgi:hypothetical protein